MFLALPLADGPGAGNGATVLSQTESRLALWGWARVMLKPGEAGKAGDLLQAEQTGNCTASRPCQAAVGSHPAECLGGQRTGNSSSRGWWRRRGIEGDTQSEGEGEGLVEGRLSEPPKQPCSPWQRHPRQPRVCRIPVARGQQPTTAPRQWS